MSSKKIAILLGFVLAVAGSPVAAQAPKTDALVPRADQSTNAAPAQGRYQIVMSPHNARDTFLLDTQTGRVWQLTVFSFLNDDPAVWNAMPRIDNDDDYSKVLNDHGRKARQSLQAK